MVNLSPRQVILSAVVASFFTSLAVSILAAALIAGLKPAQVIERIIEPTAPSPAAEKEISELILRQDELVVSVVKRAQPAVVSIVASKDVPVVERFFVDPFGDDPLFKRFFGESPFRVPQFRQKGTEKQEFSSGTGFVVSSEGLILTNKHVVADEKADYTAFFNDGSKIAAKVLARDPVQDLAVLKVDPLASSGLTAVRLGDSSKVQIGQTVIAIGNALGEFKNTVSVGVVSGLGRSIVASGPGIGPEQLQELIQTDAAINPGNSGGPLLNLYGEVIGINVAMAQGAENIGFAIPISKAIRDIESVKATGRIIYPFLGIRYVMVTKEIQEKEKLAVDYGALLISGDGEPAVVNASPAEKAGLKEGDIILEFSGEKIEPSRTLASLIFKYKVGDTVTLKVLRGSQTFTVSVTLEERK